MTPNRPPQSRAEIRLYRPADRRKVLSIINRGEDVDLTLTERRRIHVAVERGKVVGVASGAIPLQYEGDARDELDEKVFYLGGIRLADSSRRDLFHTLALALLEDATAQGCRWYEAHTKSRRLMQWVHDTFPQYAADIEMNEPDGSPRTSWRFRVPLEFGLALHRKVAEGRLQFDV